MSKKSDRMYCFVDRTKNPLGGGCEEHGCIYCYIHGIRGFKTRFPVVRNKYSGAYKLYLKVLDEVYKPGEIIFFCDCIDYLAKSVPVVYIHRIFEWIERSPRTTFLSLTKNPERYKEFKSVLPVNVVMGLTVESNINYPEYSNAPLQIKRINSMVDIFNMPHFISHKRFISIEPILDFNIAQLLMYIHFMQPNSNNLLDYDIAVGYDSLNMRLKEPELAKTRYLIDQLRKRGYKVLEKLLRKAWWEQ